MRQWVLYSINLVRDGQHWKRVIHNSLGLAKILLLFAVAVLFSFALSNGNAFAGKLFQSPQSPAEIPANQLQNAAQPQEQPVDQSAPGTDPFQEQAEPQSEVVPGSAQPPTPAPLPRQPRRQVDAEEDERSGSNNFTLNRGQLVDSFVVSAAYVWLCCGIILFLLLPLGFIFLHIRGRSKINKEDIP